MQKEFNLYTVEDTIRAMRVVPGVLNLVEDIQKGALFTGAAAGLAGQAGMLASAASLALYEGEDVEHIALLINDQLAIGTFEWLQDLKVGDEVKLVVSDLEDGPLFIHAILHKSDQLLWMPYSVDHTRFGWIMHAVKLSIVVLFMTWFMFGGFFLIDAALPGNKELMWLVILPILLMSFVGFMSTRGMMELGEQAENIFKVLGVPKFERFRIKPFSLMMDFSVTGVPDRQRKGYIFKFSEALAAHKKKFNLP